MPEIVTAELQEAFELEVHSKQLLAGSVSMLVNYCHMYIICMCNRHVLRSFDHDLFLCLSLQKLPLNLRVQLRVSEKVNSTSSFL